MNSRTELENVNEELRRLAMLLPDGGKNALAARLKLHRNTVGAILQGVNLNLTDNVVMVNDGLRSFLRDRIDELMDEANTIHAALKPVRKFEITSHDKTEA